MELYKMHECPFCGSKELCVEKDNNGFYTSCCYKRLSDKNIKVLSDKGTIFLNVVLNIAELGYDTYIIKADSAYHILFVDKQTGRLYEGFCDNLFSEAENIFDSFNIGPIVKEMIDETDIIASYCAQFTYRFTDVEDKKTLQLFFKNTFYGIEKELKEKGHYDGAYGLYTVTDFSEETIKKVVTELGDESGEHYEFVSKVDIHNQSEIAEFILKQYE